ncbi:MAG: imidazole glycerol phosphate synthase subunit HisH [Candidatus Riflebacteria bacterium]|nr:imidazole glycerol phosphate synthase subunit HisH [Candidatus Riflebacteria bacterium]
MVGIVDCGLGNLGALMNMLRRIGADPARLSQPEQIVGFPRLILPGVGAFDTGMKSLAEKGFLPFLHQAVRVDRKPILGVCLGMQLLGRKSEEGTMEGLGWIDAETIRFRFPPGTREWKVPHMGWSTLTWKRVDSLANGLEEESRFYFVHSYHLRVANPEVVVASGTYGIDFPAVIREGNILGVQFHPEKSHRFGFRLLANFLEIPGP